MDYDKFETGDGVEVRIPKTLDYRTCSECGGDCTPEPSPDDGLGVRVLFVCPEHGAQSIVDPFDDKR